MILNASGCLDALTAPDVARSLDAFVTKTVTPLPREGNDPVRIAETDAGMLNSIGLQNPGIDAFCKDVLPRLREMGVEVTDERPYGIERTGQKRAWVYDSPALYHDVFLRTNSR